MKTISSQERTDQRIDNILDKHNLIIELLDEQKKFGVIPKARYEYYKMQLQENIKHINKKKYQVLNKIMDDLIEVISWEYSYNDDFRPAY